MILGRCCLLVCRKAALPPRYKCNSCSDCNCTDHHTTPPAGVNCNAALAGFHGTYCSTMNVRTLAAKCKEHAKASLWQRIPLLLQLYSHCPAYPTKSSTQLLQCLSRVRLGMKLNR
jgi:hypothetical protein